MDIDNVDNKDLVGDGDLDGKGLDDLLGDEIGKTLKSVTRSNERKFSMSP